MKITLCVLATALLVKKASFCPSTAEVDLEGYRYTRVENPADFSQASFNCFQFHDSGYIVHIKTENVSAVVDQIISGCSESFRIGLEHDTGINGDAWYWTDSDTFDDIEPQPLLPEESRWENGQGGGSGAISACVVPGNRTWIEVTDSSSHWFICETNLLTLNAAEEVLSDVGDTLTLQVAVRSVDGQVNISLYKDWNYDILLDSTLVGSGEIWSYEISSVTESDDGIYEFVATRDNYKRTVSTLLIVQDRVKIVSELPRKVSSPVTRGPRSMECEATGIPTPTVNWMTNNVSVREDSTGPGVYQTLRENIASLNIEKANSTDDGQYICMATNTILVGTSNMEFKDISETRLRVLGQPIIIGVELIDCTNDMLRIRLNWKADNQTLGINHIIEAHTVADSYSSNVTSANESNMYTNITLSSSDSVEIKVTVCPDDCIVTLSDETIFSITTPNAVTDANVSKGNGSTSKSICEVRWSWTEQNYTKDHVEFKVQRTSVLARTRGATTIQPNITTVTFPAIVGYNYEAMVETNMNNTFDIFATNCAGDSVAVTAVGECITGSAAPIKIGTLSSAPSSRSCDGTHSIVVDVPDERNGPISCLFVIVRRGGGSIEAVSAERLQTLSENSISDWSTRVGREYIAVSIPMYTVFDKGSITVVIGGNKSSSCGIYEISSTDNQSSDVYRGVDWVLENNLNYSASLVSTTPGDMKEIFIAQAETFTFRGICNQNKGPRVEVIVPVTVAALLSVLFGILIHKYLRNTKDVGPCDTDDENHSVSSDNDGSPTKDPSANNGASISTNGEIRLPTIRSPTAMALGELLQIFSSLSQNEGLVLLTEFQRVKDQAHLIADSASVGSSVEVKTKNRYKNVIPYDHSRVSLIASGGSGAAATYINASYIRGFERARKFIATQGPLPSTINDFWQMVMQEKVRVIAMVTNLVENTKKKCECYWPDVYASGDYGNIKVSTVSQHRLGGITKRIFELTHRSSGHRVIQYQLMDWPDHGVPNSTTNFLRFYKACVEAQGKNEEPIIVHCSAGAGRTGTFIAYDYLIHEAMKHGVVDPFECVSTMRGQRMDMVQTSDQYQFIYRLVTEYHLFKDSDLDTNIFYSNSSANKPSNSKLRRQVENLKVAASFPKIAPQKAAIAIHVPVRWRPEDGENIPMMEASRVETYDSTLELIACIPPTKSTADIFWRLNLDNEIQFIVSINDSSLDPKENVNECWPSEEHIKKDFASVSATLLNADDRKDFQVNAIRVQRESSLQTKEMRQYNILKWRPKVALEVLTDIKSAISLMSTSKPRRILVHCRREFGETGSFCALINLLSRMDTEERVDVFRTAKDLKDAHVGLIQDQKQYKFCYDALRSCDHASGRKSSESTSQYQNHSAYENEPSATGKRANGRMNSEKMSPSQNNSPYENEPATTSL